MQHVYSNIIISARRKSDPSDEEQKLVSSQGVHPASRIPIRSCCYASLLSTIKQLLAV